MKESTSNNTNNANNEMSLQDLLTSIWEERLLVILILLCCLMTGGSYIFISSPTYESKSILLPPPQEGIIELQKTLKLLNFAGQKVVIIQKHDIFDHLVNNLNSNRYKGIFSKQNHIRGYFSEDESSDLDIQKNFSEALTLKHPKKKPYDHIELSLETSTAESAEKILKDYIEFVTEQTKSEILKNSAARIESAKYQLKIKADAEFSHYTSALHEQIRDLKEALLIAESIGLEEPLPLEGDFYKPMLLSEVRSIYRLGAKALRAEIKAFEKRLSSSTTPQGIKKLNLQLELLRKIELNQENLRISTIDLPPQASASPIKPKKTLTLILSISLGMILGVMTATIRAALRSTNET